MSFGERLDNVSLAKLCGYVNNMWKNVIIEQVGAHSLLVKNQNSFCSRKSFKSCDAAMKHMGKGDPEDTVYLEFQKSFWRLKVFREIKLPQTKLAKGQEAKTRA